MVYFTKTRWFNNMIKGIIYVTFRLWFTSTLFYIWSKYLATTRTNPCGRNKKENFLCCELSPTVNNSYIEFDNHGFEIKCKVCNGSHMISTSCRDVHNIEDAIDYYYGKGKFEGDEW